jgi:hypothetical protein
VLLDSSHSITGVAMGVGEPCGTRKPPNARPHREAARTKVNRSVVRSGFPGNWRSNDRCLELAHLLNCDQGNRLHPSEVARMRKIRLLVLLLTLGLIPATAANAAPIVAGDIVRLTDGIGTTNGGEFNMFVNGSATSFITFCLQQSETILFNTDLRVGSVSTYADDAGGNDTLSYQTAWLYENFRNGTLAGYTQTNKNANLLQTAIWYFEGEGFYSDPNGNKFILAANQAVANGYNTLGNVQVVNLFYANGQKAQDQLILQAPAPPPPPPPTQQVPGPAALTLMAPAALGLAFMRRRRQQ